jgi:CheY-like chemotaxis protein
VRIKAVVEDPELEWLKIGLAGMKLRHAIISTHASDLEALQSIYVEGRPDLLVIDLELQGVIGLETVRAIRQQKELEGLPIVLVSDDEVVMGPRASLRTQVLLKPAHPDGWIDAIRAALAAPPPRPAPPAEAPAAKEPPPSQLKHAPRKAERKAFETPCLVTTTGGKVKGILRDISLTGAKITTNEPLKSGSMATLILGIPGTVPLKIIQVKARVVRRTLDGHGIAFSEMDPDTRTLVLAVTQK